MVGEIFETQSEKRSRLPRAVKSPQASKKQIVGESRQMTNLLVPSLTRIPMPLEGHWLLRIQQEKSKKKEPKTFVSNWKILPLGLMAKFNEEMSSTHYDNQLCREILTLPRIWIKVLEILTHSRNEIIPLVAPNHYRTIPSWPVEIISEEIKKAHSDTRNQIQVITDGVDATFQKLAHTDELEEQVKKQEAKIISLNADLEIAETNKAEMEITIKRNNNTLWQLHRRLKEIKALESQKTDYTFEHNAYRDEIERLKSTVNKLQKIIFTLKKQNNNLRGLVAHNERRGAKLVNSAVNPGEILSKILHEKQRNLEKLLRVVKLVEESRSVSRERGSQVNSKLDNLQAQIDES